MKSLWELTWAHPNFGRLESDETTDVLIIGGGNYFLKLYQRRSYIIALEQAANVDGMYIDEAEDGLSFPLHIPPPTGYQRLGSHGQSADTHNKALHPSGLCAEMEFPGTPLGLSLSRFPL